GGDISDGPRPGPARRRGLIASVAAGRGHDRRYAIDPAKIEAELGWRAAESFESGLRKTVRWYIDNRAWWEPLRAGVYGGERLGLPEAGRNFTPQGPVGPGLGGGLLPPI